MHSFAITRSYPTQTTGRTCGPCYACCVHLGIEELRKYAGQTCRLLKGGADRSKRCSIYETRPAACSGYSCLWLVGFGPDDLRPHESGILITVYDAERNGISIAGKASATVNIFDMKKAQGKIASLLAELIAIPIMDEVRLIYLEEKRGLLIRDGFIYGCDTIPSKGYEALCFAAHEPPLGRYRTEDAASLSDLQERHIL